MDVFAEYSYRVRGYECGPDGLATLPTVCNYLQDAASLHAEQLGFSKSDFEVRGVGNISWVLTRLRVKMQRFPRWQEEIAVLTYPRPGRHVTVFRDFVLRSGEETIGTASSEWVVIDLATRKLVEIPKFVYAYANDVRVPVMGAEAFSRLRWTCREAVPGDRVLRARRGDIDLNGHVNNVHYIAWLLEALPEGAGSVRDFQIVFRSETLAGEEVRAAAVEVTSGVWAAHVAAADGRDHVVAEMTVR